MENFEDLSKEQLNEKLIKASKEGDLDVVEQSIKYGADVNTKDRWGHSMLHIAVQKINVELVQKLVKKGANVNMIDSITFTPLRYAMANSYDKEPKLLDITKILLEQKPDLTLNDYAGKTPLNAAIEFKATKTAVLLIEGGADIDLVDESGYAPLHCVGNSGTQNIELLKILLEKGARTSVKDKFGETPFESSLYLGNGEENKEIKELLKSYTDFNESEEQLIEIYNSQSRCK